MRGGGDGSVEAHRRGVNADAVSHVEIGLNFQVRPQKNHSKLESRTSQF